MYCSLYRAFFGAALFTMHYACEAFYLVYHAIYEIRQCNRSTLQARGHESIAATLYACVLFFNFLTNVVPLLVDFRRYFFLLKLSVCLLDR